jgi:F0F1-type ATP synthase membrane subunit b/b'
MRFRWLALGALLLAPLAFGAEKKEAGDEGKWMPWKWANFLILAGGLGYLIGKNSGGFFRGRTEAIQKDMAESSRLKAEAEAKAREIASRLDALGAEIEKLRAEAKATFSVEGEHIRQETEKHLARVQQQTEREIDSMSKAARAHLRAYAAQLAVDLAEERIRTRMDPAAQSRLLDNFTRGLGTTGPEARQ